MSFEGRLRGVETELALVIAVAAEVPGSRGLSGRCSHKHFVVRGNEPKAAVLIAAREDNCTYLELLEYDRFVDNTYKEKKKDNGSGVKDAHMQGWFQTECRPLGQIGYLHGRPWQC